MRRAAMLFGLAIAFTLARPQVAAAATLVPLHATDWSHAHGASQGAGKVYRLPFGHREAPNRTGYYYISHARPIGGRPVLIAFHGYKGDGEYVAQWFAPLAEARGLAIIAPDSAGDNWEVPHGGQMSADVQHILDATMWLERHAGQTDTRRYAAMGHSYGTRMAAFIGTNVSWVTHTLISHGRFVPETLGTNLTQAWFSGSPRDPWFDFKVMQDQWQSFPALHKDLHTFACPTCGHPPEHDELVGMADFVAYGG